LLPLLSELPEGLAFESARRFRGLKNTHFGDARPRQNFSGFPLIGFALHDRQFFYLPQLQLSHFV
jgi:hypothetical protein